jgi:hypothetical protein
MMAKNNMFFIISTKRFNAAPGGKGIAQGCIYKTPAKLTYQANQILYPSRLNNLYIVHVIWPK